LLTLQASDRALSRAASAKAAALASPQMPTEMVFTSPSSLASASTWMIFASFGLVPAPACPRAATLALAPARKCHDKRAEQPVATANR